MLNTIYTLYFFRSFLGTGIPAQWPSANRISEALCIKLCALYHSPKKTKKVYTPRWKLVLESYREIRSLILNNQEVMDKTNIVLVPLNQATLSQW